MKFDDGIHTKLKDLLLILDNNIREELINSKYNDILPLYIKKNKYT